ncbi:MAG: hypothetical protein AABM64_15095 [Pseudomonadota bacterium]
MESSLLEWVKVIGPLIFSWPVAILILACVFQDLIRKLANRFIDSSGATAEFGPLKVQLGSIAKESQHVLERLNEFLELSARNRLFMNEVLIAQLGHRFTAEQIEQMKERANEINALLEKKRG